MITEIKKEREIESIFKRTCEIQPSNTEDSLLDGCFSAWQPYGCSKPNESYYKLTHVYTISQGSPFCMESDYITDNYSDPLYLAQSLSVMYHEEESVAYLPALNDLLSNRLKPSASTSSIMSEMDDDDIYGIRDVDIQKINLKISEAELEFTKQVVSCLSDERASDYHKWLSVGMCLHNMNPNLLDAWKLFSQQDDSYNPEECERKWISFNRIQDGQSLGMGSLIFWARTDNKDKYEEILKTEFEPHINQAIRKGAAADYLVALVVHKWFEKEFICVDVDNEWYFFNGTRWENTIRGTELKKRIHNDIFTLFGTKYLDYASKCQIDPDDKNASQGMKNVVELQIKVSKAAYANTLLVSLRDLFHVKDIMETFDTNHDLLGFTNGVYDLKAHMFREGRPEDYITMSTGVEMPVEKEDLPMSKQALIAKIRKIPHYDRLDADFHDFFEKILPDPDLRAYMKRFIAKCISGENRDEGFYIWTGSGGNGKSKLVDLIGRCLGDYACNLPVALLTQKRKSSGAADPEMARTRGKRFVYMQEPDVNETLNIGEMKEITGNDTIQARCLYENPFEFTPQFKLVLMCNDKPKIPSNDDGTWRRLQVSPFVSRFVDEDEDPNPEEHRYLKDKTLTQKLDKWVLPMYTMLFEEWSKYDVEGIIIPQCIKNTTLDYRNENDIVGQWIYLKCEPADCNPNTGQAPTHLDELWNSFDQWQEDEDKKPTKKPDFKKAIIKWQESSKYKFHAAKAKSVKVHPNGTQANPMINLVLC